MNKTSVCTALSALPTNCSSTVHSQFLISKFAVILNILRLNSCKLETSVIFVNENENENGENEKITNSLTKTKTKTKK